MRRAKPGIKQASDDGTVLDLFAKQLEDPATQKSIGIFDSMGTYLEKLKAKKALRDQQYAERAEILRRAPRKPIKDSAQPSTLESASVTVKRTSEGE